MLNELSSLVSRVIIISEWRIKLDDTMLHIRALAGWQAPYKDNLEWLVHPKHIKSKFPDIVGISVHGQKMEIVSSRDISQELLLALAHEYHIVEFFSEKLSLSDVFFDTIK